MLMKEHLIIKNFGPVTSLDIEIKRMTLFVGNQGSGKSTVAKVLTICRDCYWQQSISKGDGGMKQFKDLGIDRFFYPDSIIEYCFIGLIFRYENGRFSVQKTDGTQGNIDDILFDWLFQNDYRRHFAGYTPTKNDSVYQDIFMMSAISKTLLYIPAERIIAAQLSLSLASVFQARIPLNDAVLQYMSFFEKARKEFPTYDVPFLNATYTMVDGREVVKVGSGDRKKELPLNLCSSGLQSVLPLLMVIDYCVKQSFFDSFVIEEPEQNLFPLNQLELLRFLLSRWNGQGENKAGMVITTHSPYLLSALNNSLYAWDLTQSLPTADVEKVVPKEYWLNPDECAIYSLGEELNGGEYCKSVISAETNLIDFNYLDAVSIQMSEEFDQLQDLYLANHRKQH